LWDATERAIPRVAALDEPAIAALVTRHVRLKARVVERDERETSIKPDGGRMMLNLGHTFAHVLEVLGGLSWELEPLPSAPRSGSVEAPAATLRSIQHGPLLHGEAVGLGLLAACTAGERLKITPRGLGERVRAALLAAGLPTRVMGLPSASTVAQRMQDDKKVSGGHLRLIVPTAGWKARVVVQPAMEAVTAGIDSLREG
jgi:3-dehydroquinate synthetase